MNVGNDVDIRLCKFAPCGKRFAQSTKKTGKPAAFCCDKCRRRFYCATHDRSAYDKDYQRRKLARLKEAAIAAGTYVGPGKYIRRIGERHKRACAPPSHWVNRALQQLRFDYANNKEALAWIEANAGAITPDMAFRTDSATFSAISLENYIEKVENVYAAAAEAP